MNLQNKKGLSLFTTNKKWEEYQSIDEIENHYPKRKAGYLNNIAHAQDTVWMYTLQEFQKQKHQHDTYSKLSEDVQNDDFSA